MQHLTCHLTTLTAQPLLHSLQLPLVVDRPQWWPQLSKSSAPSARALWERVPDLGPAQPGLTPAQHQGTTSSSNSSFLSIWKLALRVPVVVTTMPAVGTAITAVAVVLSAAVATVVAEALLISGLAVAG